MVSHNSHCGFGAARSSMNWKVVDMGAKPDTATKAKGWTFFIVMRDDSSV